MAGREDLATSIDLRPVESDDHRVLHELFDHVVATSGGYPHVSPVAEEEFRPYWLEGKSAVIVAESDGQIIGSYFLKANHPGRASHIANAGFIVAPSVQGRGVGRRLVEDALDRARELGFEAMQFNLVLASNPARPMYEDLGFEVIGRVPDAVGGEDAVIYWRRL